MKKIDSQTITLPKASDRVFAVMSDFRNFATLIAPDKLDRCTINNDTVTFPVSGMGNLTVKIIQDADTQTIRYQTIQSPIGFELHIQLTPQTPTTTQIDLSVFSDANPMILMMLKNPIRNFLQMAHDKAEEMSDKIV